MSPSGDLGTLGRKLQRVSYVGCRGLAVRIAFTPTDGSQKGVLISRHRSKLSGGLCIPDDLGFSVRIRIGQEH